MKSLCFNGWIDKPAVMVIRLQFLPDTELAGSQIYFIYFQYGFQSSIFSEK